MKPLSLLRLPVLLLIASSGLLAQQKKADRSLLWEISGKGLAHPSYLYGTFHVEDKRVFDFTDSVLLKFHECTAFASEIVLDSAVREVFRRSLEKMIDEENDEAVVTPAGDAMEPGDPRYDTLAAVVDSLAKFHLGHHDDSANGDVPPAMPDVVDDQSEPADDPGSGESGVTVAEDDGGTREKHHSTFSSDLFKTQRARRRPGDRPVFLDAYFYQLAKQEGKKIIGLERVAEQLDLGEPSLTDFWNFYFNRSRKGKHRIIRGKEEGQEEMLRYYHEGDLNQLLAIMRESFPPDYFKRLLTDRNHNMADRAVKYMEEGPTFIAVGAGHLPGREGVIELLRQKGYTVRPVTTSRTGLAAKYQPPEPREEWTLFTPRDGGFSVEFPTEPIDISLIANGGRIDTTRSPGSETMLYGWPDIGTGIEYFAGYTDYQWPPGIETPDDFKDWVKSIYGNGQAPDSVATVYAGGLRGGEVETVEDESHQRTRYFLRGNRLYRLKVLTVPELVRSPRAERFFASFHLDPPAPLVWTDFAPGDSGFSVKFPAAPKIYRAGYGYWEQGDKTFYVAVDKYSGMSYRLERTEFSEYYQDSSITSILMRGLTDSEFATNRRVFMLDGSPAVEFDEPLTETTFKRNRRVLCGERLYELSAVIDRTADSAAPLAFLNSLKVQGDTATSRLLTDKGAAILRDIGSASAVRREHALNAARFHDFTKGDLPAVYASLRHAQPDDMGKVYGVRSILFDFLGKIRDTSAIRFIREVYPSLPASADLRGSALAALAGIGTDTSVNLFFDLVAKEPMLSRMTRSGLLDPFQSDIRNAAPLVFPRVFSLLDTKSLRSSIYDLTITALDSGVLTPAAIAEEKHAFLWDGIGLLMLRRDLSQDDQDYWLNTGQLGLVCHLLGYFPGDSEVTAFLRKVVVDRDKDVAFSAAISMLRLREQVDPEVLQNIAADDILRIRLYRKLEEINRLDVFPARYRDQRSIAWSALAEWVNNDQEEDGDPVDSSAVIDERIVTHGGETGRAFLFKFRFAGSSEKPRWYVGISGLQPKAGDRISTKENLVGSRYDLLEKKSIDEHYKTLMEATTN
ncbi:MAG: TraB/GumN family protein [Chlorobi bacterium]|nr:TraB/GumN family protein [Chlorobiota bacterium]